MWKLTKLFFLLSISALTLTSSAWSQVNEDTGSNQHEVSGVVTDDEGATLSGVNITVKGTSTGTTTNMEGTYELTVNSLTDTLIFSFVGYRTREIPISGRSEINVELQQTVLSGEEIAVVGYQTQSAEELTGSISQVQPEDIANSTTTNPVQALQGRVAGVEVQTSGEPSGEATIRVRGTSTLGNNDPLFIIDGVPTKSGMIQHIDPNQIESMQVLKDAAATSIYGARASNGVIIITTKQAQAGDLQVNINSDVTTQHWLRQPQVLNTLERGQALWRASINDGVDPNERPLYDYNWHTNDQEHAILDEVIPVEWVDQEFGGGIKAQVPGTNWFDEITQTGVIFDNNISVSTGNERGGGTFSLNHLSNSGTVIHTQYSRISGRINSHYNFFDGALKVGENLQLAKSKHTPREKAEADPIGIANIQQPILPVHTEDGGWAGPIGAGFADRENPVRLMVKNRWDKDHEFRTFGNVYAEIEPTSNLIFRTSFGIDYTNGHGWDYALKYQEGFMQRTVNSVTKYQNHDINWNWDNTLRYQLDLADHSFNFLAGVEAINSEFRFNESSREEFAIEERSYLTIGSGTGSQNTTGFITGYQLLSYFGKVNYNYNNKYLATGTLRYDGSSRFGENYRYGLFPAFSVGWRISEESFFPENLSNTISNLKIRFGWGKTGNQEIANDARYTLFQPSYGQQRIVARVAATAYDLAGNDSGTLPSGFRRVQTGNSDLKWEATTESNFGVDFDLFDGNITGSFDYFRRNTEDILIQPEVLGIIGEGANRWVNGATVEAYGFETSLGYNNQSGNLTYDISLNLSSANDEITFLPPSVVDSYPGNSKKNILGHSMHSLFGYVADGIFRSQEEVEAHATQPGKDIGRIRYKDLNGDGQITPLDQKYMGVEQPDLQYGLSASISYKRFDFIFFLQGVQGIEVYNGWKGQSDFTGFTTGSNYGERVLDAWSPTNRDSNIPALSLSDRNDEARPSTYFVEDGTYLKLRNAQISYNLPQNVLDTFKMNSMRIYVRGENLFTIVQDNSGNDKFTGIDPENWGLDYPRPVTFTIGLNVQL